MEIKKIKAALAGLVIMGLTFTACSGDDGDQGPAGPAGADGNANVISNTFTLTGTDWSAGNATISVPALTKEIADNGQVAVFFTFDSLSTDTITWNPLPWRFVGNVGGTLQFITIQNTVSVGQVQLSARLNTNGGVNLGGQSNVRVVLIPSNQRVDGVKLDDYENVIQVYGLSENEL